MIDPVARYSAALAEDTLGLPTGELDPSMIPKALANRICSAIEGSQDSCTATPSLQEELNRFGEMLAGHALRERGHFALKSRWPNRAPHASCITHDVDNIRRPFRHILSVRHRFSSADLLMAGLGLRSLYNNIALVAKLEREKAVHSSYFFLTSNYDLGSMAAQLAQLKRDGWEVGLHGSIGTRDSPVMMKEDIARFAKALGYNPAGVREHFLQFDYAKTWQIMEEAGFAYDTTVGTRDSLGFRVGLCVPFHPPTKDWNPMKLLELPLVLMDTTLWGYLKLSEEEGLERTRDLISLVSATGGLFTILWHQEAVRMKGGRIYPRVLDDLVAGGAWVANAYDVASWWNARAVPLQRRGDTYLLLGEPPTGLYLEVFAREGLSPAVKGGVVERVGDRFLVRVQSNDFIMEMR
jgi:peptidoglycan/xylan/chitin deacetylase (PgdA/CDA1 family)